MPERIDAKRIEVPIDNRGIVYYREGRRSCSRVSLLMQGDASDGLSGEHI